MLKVSSVCFVTFAILLSGCDRKEPSVTRVPKETPAPINAAASADPHADPHGGMMGGLQGPQLEWQTPSGWREEGAARMSVANFSTQNDKGTVAVSIIPLPGAAGKELDVLNIFRERYQLPPLTGAELTAMRQAVPMGEGQEGQVFEMNAPAAGTNAASGLLVGVLTRDPLCWYVRMTGESGAVAAEKPKFLEFFKTLKVADGDGGMPPQPPPMVAAPNPGAAPARALPQWEVPEGWQSQSPPPMVLARFVAGPAEGAVDVSVSVFPGDVGGLVANVNRWRGQIGLAPISDEEVAKGMAQVETADGSAQVVEMKGKRGTQEVTLIGAVVPRGEGPGKQTWFYKLVGDPATASAQKENFLRFVKSARHPAA